VVIYRAYNFTKYFLEPSRKSFGQGQINSTTSITQSIQHPGVINGNTVYPSYNAYAYPGQGHPYPQQIDIPIGFVNSYTECLEQVNVLPFYLIKLDLSERLKPKPKPRLWLKLSLSLSQR
jgi:hypothetical protein